MSRFSQQQISCGCIGTATDQPLKGSSLLPGMNKLGLARPREGAVPGTQAGYFRKVPKFIHTRARDLRRKAVCIFTGTLYPSAYNTSPHPVDPSSFTFFLNASPSSTPPGSKVVIMETGPSDPSTPNYTNSLDWITAYLTVHSMSKASYRVTYALWIIIATFFIIGTIIHLAGTDRPWYFAHWSKWALRRRTWRKNRGKKGVEESGKPHRQPTPLPPNSQLLSLAFIFVLTMILAFAGPDYIYPSTKTSASISDPVPSPSDNQQREVDREEVQQYVARYTIQKAWWTVAGRTGLMAFALFPLCILFALKAAPFALFALPYTTQLSFDKLSTMHRWVARLIWFFTLIHVISWCVQFATHDDPVTGKIAFTNALIYPPFYWGTAVRFSLMCCQTN